MRTNYFYPQGTIFNIYNYLNLLSIQSKPKDILMLQNMGYLDMFVFFLVKNARLDILQHIKDDNKVYSNFDIKLPHDNGTPLHYAIIMHARESNPQLKITRREIIEWLIVELGDQGIEKATNDGRKAIHFAAFYGDLAIVKLLIYHEVSISDKTRHDKSAIMLAAEGSYYDIILRLYINGAQLPTALERQNLHPLAVKFIHKLEEVDMLNVIDGLSDAEEGIGVDFDKILNAIETKVSQITDDASLDRFFAEVPHYIPDTESHVICNDCETFPDIEQNWVGRF